ncbi:MAG: segregation/condensation protein A [Candidatus Nomurabacteria bacterium]|nr:segregation/condensation protein A [Candidatus Nomurabacteria bacterium]USN87906.1 MAG: segregation/condensation protein A [Candidatus Nomurabacteria bacterium]
MQPLATSNFSIKTDVFEGPLELLLDLVEKRKLLINDISLAAVTDEYMRHVSEMQEMSLPNTAQFISLAATLLLVKSKSLLPVLELTEEEESSIEDLEERLKRYQVIRDAAVSLQNIFGKNRLYGPKFTAPATPLFLPDKYCQLSQLHQAMIDAINGLPKKESPAKAQIKTVISLEQMMQNLEARIKRSSYLRFSDLSANEPEKKMVIVSFLAVLELFKQGNLIITQSRRYDDIEIELDKSQTPTYY